MATPPDTSPIEIGSLAQWAAATATFLAVLVALFKDEILRWWRQPKLTVSIRLRPPDCHKTTVNYTVHRTALVQGSAECYYLRLWIRNEGKTRAERVQVFAAKLLRRAADGTFKEVETFSPMNLRWSHAQMVSGVPEIFAEGISPGMGKHCDFARVVDPKHHEALDEILPTVGADQSMLALELEITPNMKGHLIPPGAYRIYLQVAAANARPTTKVLELNITGKWFSDQNQMFSEGLGVTVVDT